MNKQDFEALDSFFHPRSIAVVGVSRDMAKAGTFYLQGLLRARFKGKTYPVNSNGGEILGLKAYARVADIPGPVDYVIVSVPRQSVLGVLDDCAAKGVKAVQLFVAGFSELGDEESLKLEGEMVKKARQGGFRLIGPNCIGLSCPAINFPLGPEAWLAEAGQVGFASQSGSLAGRLTQVGIARGIRFSKIVSFGNGCDLSGLDFLEYLALDPETRAIGCYLEGVEDGRRLFGLLKETASRKPMVFLKGGMTGPGARAALSHTGSAASSAELWTAVLRQTGGILVKNLEEMADALLAFQFLPFPVGRRLTIVSGLADGGGGEAVSATDTSINLGLEVPDFAPQTRHKLTALLGPVGSILHNPLDVSQAYSNHPLIARALDVAAADPNIDAIIIEAVMDNLLRDLPEMMVYAMIDVLIDFKRKQAKPVVVALPPSLSEADRKKTEKRLNAAEVPVYPSLERAARAIAHLHRYSEFRQGPSG